MPTRKNLKGFIANIAETHVLAAGRTFVVIGPNVWGKSRDIHTALKNAQKQTGQPIKRVIVYDAQDDARINEYGDMVYVPRDGVEPYELVGKYE